MDYGPLGGLVTPAVAEARANALLRALVPAEAWGMHEITAFEATCSCCRGEPQVKEAIEVVGSVTGRTYLICTDSTVYNVFVDGQKGCAVPWSAPEYQTGGMRNGYPAYDTLAWMKDKDTGMSVTLPSSDTHLGQYLTIKHNEQAFLDKVNGLKG